MDSNLLFIVFRQLCSRSLYHTSIQQRQQINLIEGIAKSSPGVKNTSLGDICNELTSWPHTTLKESLKKIYGFTSDYPGIRHSGNKNSKLREIEMRDMVAVSILLAGFAPYLTDQINADIVYRGEL